MDKSTFIIYCILIIFFMAVGYLLHPVISPCPTYTVDTTTHIDTVTTTVRDTITLPPIVETLIQKDTVFAVNDSIFISKYSKRLAKASVEMEIYAPCPVDSVHLKINFAPLAVIAREKMVISTDTIRTFVVEKPIPLLKKVNYAIIGGFLTGITLILMK